MVKMVKQKINTKIRMDHLLGQFNRAIKASGVVKYKTSKKTTKIKVIAQLKDEGKAITSHNIATKAPIHSSGTYDNFYSKVRMLSKYISENHRNIKDISQIGRATIEGFLMTAVNKGVKLDTYDNYKSDLTKVQLVLTDHFQKNGIERSTDFFDKAKDFVDRSKQIEDLETKVDARSYLRPEAMINALDREDHKLVASIQLEGGGRINEASLIDDKRLGGIVDYRGAEMGVIHLQKGDAKGGLARDLHVSKSLYQKLEKYVAENGKLHVERGYQRDNYRACLEKAAEKTDQKYSGSHGLRHNYAQNRVAELKAEGMGHSAALTVVSVEMGHFREDITEYYLRT